jgi:hypothetical protein
MVGLVKGQHKLGEVVIQATNDGELTVRAIVESELEHASGDGRAYCWPSLDTDIDAGDTRLFIKNTSDKFLVLSRAIFTSSNVACKWSIGIGSESTAPTGTSVTAVNMNQQFTNTTEAYLAYDDETAVADAPIMFQVATPLALDSRLYPLDGVILGKNHYIQINQETESTSGQVVVFGHFEDELV